jgi:hypothetical protein
VSRRANPEAIHVARRMAVRSRLTGEGMAVELAERWCDAWEAEASRQGFARNADYWQSGAAWIAEQRAARRKP